MRAEIAQKFQVNYSSRYKNGSKVLVGMFTADHRHHSEDYQILVTVPQCFEILLTGPSEYGQEWVKNIEYVIFDQVHNINDASTGHVWERILLLNTAPFIALSATLGSPAEFQMWLQMKSNKR